MTTTNNVCSKCGAPNSLRYYQTTIEEWTFRVSEHGEVELVEIIDSYIDNQMGDPYIKCLACSEEFDISQILDD